MSRSITPSSAGFRPALEPITDVVVRCRNEMPHARLTFERLLQQEGIEPRITVIDCGSTDGSRETAEASGVRIWDLDPKEYVAGRVLNLGMEITESPVVAFVNADAVPLHSDALGRLIAPLEDPRVAATFGRQLARSGADDLTRLDYERSFGVIETVRTRFGRLFSIAAAAIRRDVWARISFDTVLRYSEDVDWTLRAAALGYTIRYVPEATFEHSHGYDLRGHFARRVGEGGADARIHRIGSPSFANDLARPLAGSLYRDVRKRAISPHALAVRVSQAAGYFVGRLRSDRRRAPLAHIQGRAAASGPPRKPRRTLEGGAAECRIEGDLLRVRQAVRSEVDGELVALLLIGGYARGEGSVVERNGELEPYNDYDLLAVVRGRRGSRLRARLANLGHRLGEELGIDVDLWPIGEDELEDVPPTLLALDAGLAGAELLEGDSQLLQHFRRIRVRDVPHAEAGRLLANRAMGIALSNLETGDYDKRRARHGHKAILACGDARLLAIDRYASRLSARADELARLAGAPGVSQRLVDAYSDAVAFRRRPDLWKPAGGESLSGWFERTRAHVAESHLDYEAFRVGTPRSPLGYAMHRGPLFRDAPDIGSLRRRWGALCCGTRLFPWLGHPRERLARAAVALAYAAENPKPRAAAARLLGLPAAASSDLLHAALLRAGKVGG